MELLNSEEMQFLQGGATTMSTVIMSASVINANFNIDIVKKTDYVVVDIDDMTECATCWVRYLCRGGCLAQKISMGKTNNQAKLTNECKLEQFLWEFYMKLYYHIMQIAPGYFKIIQNEKKNC
jgi:radical SAM protein with 4Fe4S-binding SPASM domain